MTEYYVSGVIEIEGTCGRVTDEDAEFFTLYGKDDQGLSQCIADFTDRLSAEAVMQVYQERDALQQQVNALAAANSAKGRCLAFFACVIKTGEPWTETCQREYDAAQLRQPEEKGQ